MEFELSRARLRPWRIGDEEAIAPHANNRKVWRNLRDGFPHPYTVDDGRRFIEHAIADLSDTAFALEVGGEAVGSIALHPQRDVARRSAEIGYWLSEAYWSRGIMSEAVQMVTAYGLEKGLVRIFAAVFAWNLASAHVLDKAGYTLEGRQRKAVTKDGETIDELMYAVVREAD